MIKAYDFVYRYIYEKKLGYFEMADLQELFETRYKSEIVKATDKEQAKEIFNNNHKHYVDILSIREIGTAKENNNGRVL